SRGLPEVREPAALPPNPQFPLASIDGIDDVLGKTLGEYLPARGVPQPPKAAARWSKPRAAVGRCINRPGILRRHCTRMRICQKEAVTIPFDAVAAADPKTSFAILEQRANRLSKAIGAQVLFIGALGCQPHEPVRASGP